MTICGIFQLSEDRESVKREYNLNVLFLVYYEFNWLYFLFSIEHFHISVDIFISLGIEILYFWHLKLELNYRRLKNIIIIIIIYYYYIIIIIII